MNKVMNKVMKEPLVSKETAVLAKEKGFDWVVRGYYYLTDSEPSSEISSSDYNTLSRWDNEHYSAPTQSLLAKWLRDMYEIDVEVYRTWAMNKSYNYRITQFSDFENTNYQTSIPNRSFESAFEDGLLEGLKLIKL